MPTDEQQLDEQLQREAPRAYQYAHAIVREVWQALPRGRMVYNNGQASESDRFHAAVAKVVQQLQNMSVKPRDGAHQTRVIGSVVLSAILADGGRPSDFTPAIFDAVARHFRAYTQAQQTQVTRICNGCVGGFLPGPEHEPRCGRYTPQEDVPSYAGTRRPGESSMDFGIQVHEALAARVSHGGCCPKCGSSQFGFRSDCIKSCSECPYVEVDTRRGATTVTLPEKAPTEPEPATRLAAKILKAREVRLRNEAAQIGEAQTEPPPAPAIQPECPCCSSKQISYNASADVWHCPNCSWSKRQLVAPPPGPKFKIGDWVVSNRSTRDPKQLPKPSQVMGFLWSENEWCYMLHREGPGGMTSGANGTKESFLILDPYRQAAAKMFGKPVAHVTSEERQAAKLKAFKDAYTPAPPLKFYHPRPDDELRMLGKPPSWGTAW